MRKSKGYYALICLMFLPFLIPLMGADGCITITSVVPHFAPDEPDETYEVVINGGGFSSWPQTAAQWKRKICVKLVDLVICEENESTPPCEGNSIISEIYSDKVVLELSTSTSVSEGAGDVVVGILDSGDCVDSLSGNETGETFPNGFTFYDPDKVEGQYELEGQNLPHGNLWGNNIDLVDINGDGIDDIVMQRLILLSSDTDPEQDGADNRILLEIPDVGSVVDADYFELNNKHYLFLSRARLEGDWNSDDRLYEFKKWGSDWDDDCVPIPSPADACLEDVTGDMFAASLLVLDENNKPRLLPGNPDDEEAVAADVGKIEVDGSSTVAIAVANGGFWSAQGMQSPWNAACGATPSAPCNYEHQNRFYYYNSVSGVFEEADLNSTALVENSVDVEFVNLDLDQSGVDDAVVFANFGTYDSSTTHEPAQNRLYVFSNDAQGDLVITETTLPLPSPPNNLHAFTMGVDAGDLDRVQDGSGNSYADIVFVNRTKSGITVPESRIYITSKNSGQYSFAVQFLGTSLLNDIDTDRSFYDVAVGRLDDNDSFPDLIVAGEFSGIIYNGGHDDGDWVGFDEAVPLLPEGLLMAYSSSAVSIHDPEEDPTWFLLGDIYEQPRLYVFDDQAEEFDDMTISQDYFPADGNMAMDGVMGDVDSDDEPDIVVVNGMKGADSGCEHCQDFVYKNYKGSVSGHFEHDLEAWIEDSQAGAGDHFNSHSVALADINHDGCEDMFVGTGGNAIPNRIYYNGKSGNDCTGVFDREELATGYTRLESKNNRSYVSAGDTDGDGEADFLVVLNRGILNVDWVCEIVEDLSGEGQVPVDSSCDALDGVGNDNYEPAVFADLDGNLDSNSDPDLITADIAGKIRIYQLNAQGDYMVAAPLVISLSRPIYTLIVGKFDHDTDGLPDIYAGGPLGHNLLRNDSTSSLLSFSNITSGSFAISNRPENSLGGIAGDFDDDGDLDLFLVTQEDDQEYSDVVLFNLEGTNDKPIFSDLTVPFLNVGTNHARNATSLLVTKDFHYGVAVYPEPEPNVQPEFITLFGDGQNNILRRVSTTP